MEKTMKSSAKRVHKPQSGISRGPRPAIVSHGGGQRRAESGTHTARLRSKTLHAPKPSGEGVVRFIPLGGLEEVGRNMMLLEYKDEIIVIDAGLQFPEEETPGVDFIIPNTAYLEEKKENIKALIITHGHYDHIGAIPYILDRLGNPPIYTTEFTKEVIRKRQEDFPNAPKPVFQVVKAGERRELSPHFTAEFIGVTHNIPDGVGIIFETPIGVVVHPGEFKFDYDHEGNPRGLEMWEAIGKRGVHTLMLDSTGAITQGWSVSERVVEKEIEKLLKDAPGRVIVSSFASLIDRIAEIVKIAERMDKVIALAGYSLKSNFEIAKRLGHVKVSEKALIPVEDVRKHPDNKVVIIATGAQGEKNAGLMRIANGEHRHIHLKETDTVILSSSVVPGNEMSVQNLKDNIARQGPAIFDYKMLDIHSSGHAPQEELKKVMELIHPEFFVPIHGWFFMRRQNAQLALDLGMKRDRIVLADNGKVVELKKDSVQLTDKEVPSSYVFIDGLGIGDIGEVVLRDRRALAKDGMIVVITVIGKNTGKVMKNPDIISRGFIYLRESQDLLNEVRRRIRGIVGRIPQHNPLDMDYVRGLIRDQIGEFLFKKTHRRPMVLPVIIEV